MSLMIAKDSRLTSESADRLLEDINQGAPSAETLDHAQRISAENRQRAWIERNRNLWMFRRDTGRAEKAHTIQGTTLAFNTVSGFFGNFFNYRNPMNMLGSFIKASMSACVDIYMHKVKSKHMFEDSAMMKGIAHEWANDELFKVLSERPRTKDGKYVEVPELRDVALGAINEKLNRTISPKDGSNPINMQVWEKLLDCKYNPYQNKLEKIEGLDNRRLFSSLHPTTNSQAKSSAPNAASPALA